MTKIDELLVLISDEIDYNSPSTEILMGLALIAKFCFHSACSIVAILEQLIPQAVQAKGWL